MGNINVKMWYGPCRLWAGVTWYWHGWLPQSGVLCHHSPRQLSITFRQDTLYSDDDLFQYMWHCLLWTMPIITLVLITPLIHLLLPANICFHLSWATCEPHHWLIHNSFIYHLHVKGSLAQPHGSYHFRDKPWNVVESETMEIINGDKVLLRENKGATGGNCI